MQGQSQSTLNNYIRRIANISLHFQRLPEHISDDELNEYLTSLAIDKKVRAGKVQFVLPERIGRVAIKDNVALKIARQVLKEMGCQ